MAGVNALRNLASHGNNRICSLQRVNLPCVFRKSCGGIRQFRDTAHITNVPRLSPQEVNTVLRANEFSCDINITGSVKSYDSNQLPSNSPIEDTRAEARCLNTNGILIGVFDGHGGAACAQVVAKRLFNYISAALLPQDLLHQYASSLESENTVAFPLLENYNDRYDFVHELKAIYLKSFKEYVGELLDADGEKSIKAAMEQAFLRLDADLSQEALAEHDGRLDRRTLAVGLSGAVACVAHVDMAAASLHVASVGDCQAVLGVHTETGTWAATKLSVEHNTDNPAEVERIRSEHPSTENDTVIKSERLLGQLAPLRAFGDFRYKWSREVLKNIVVTRYGEEALAPHYYTPPYLTARPDITYHRLTPRDKFMVIASDGLWDLVSPLQVVRLVGEHMFGKVTLSPLRLPRKNMKLHEISTLLKQRHEGLNKVPIDRNAATHLIRNALGGTECGVEHSKISQLLSLSQEVVRLFRDDITVTVVYFDSDYLRHPI
ncbi:hypothetical protein AAG570_004296 [Ranatra chinensis]|uniref:PPM-type phosphatase domain-containing protein n=1 Tax=Ranatra chinensis TaxID=642074 RepID=A0ABD0YF82_9HEMI